MVDGTSWSLIEHAVESLVLEDAVESLNRLFDVSSGLDFQNTSETRRHQEEVELLLVLIQLLSVTELTLDLSGCNEFAALWSIDLIVCWLLRAVWYLEIASKDDLTHEAWQLDADILFVVTAFIEEAEPGDADVRIEVRVGV